MKNIVLSLLVMILSASSAGAVSTKYKLQPYKTVDIGEGFTAEQDGKSVVVHVPGAYLDSVKGQVCMAENLTCLIAEKVASKLLVNPNICITPQSKFSTNKESSHYVFRYATGTKVVIFTYLNDLDGVTAVVNDWR